MPERLTHQALPALACSVGLLGPSVVPLGAPLVPVSCPWGEAGSAVAVGCP